MHLIKEFQDHRIKTQMKRRLRVAEIIRRTLTVPLQRFPLLSKHKQIEVMINVTVVNMSSDLKKAHVFVSCFGKHNTSFPDDWLKQLRLASKSLRAHLKHQLDLRFIPELHFLEDDSFSYADNIERLIAENQLV